MAFAPMEKDAGAVPLQVIVVQETDVTPVAESVRLPPSATAPPPEIPLPLLIVMLAFCSSALGMTAVSDVMLGTFSVERIVPKVFARTMTGTENPSRTAKATQRIFFIQALPRR